MNMEDVIVIDVWSCGSIMGSICDDCGNGREESCTHKYIMFGTNLYKRLTKRNGVEDEEGSKCHDCGIIIEGNNIHHTGCDWEECPRCGGQLISCGCHNVFCDITCGNWYEDGCEENHAGAPYHTIPNGYTITKPSKETIKKNMSLRTKEVNLWMVQGDANKIKGILIKKLDDKFGGVNDAFKLIINMVFDQGKKWQEAEDTIKLLRERNRSNG